MLAISRFAKHWFESFQQHRARKAKNCSKSSFSGLRTEFQEQPINTKRACQILYTTTPKSKELLQKLAFGAVDGISKAANEYKTCLSDPTTAPRSKELLQTLVFGAVGGAEFHKQLMNTKRACQIVYHSPEKQANAAKARFRSCGRKSTSSQWQILPQPRKAHNCSNSSFSGLWTEFHTQPMTDPTTAPQRTQLLQKLLLGAMDGIPHAANYRSYHSPEKHTIAPKARFRGCGRNSTSSQWQILPQPRKANNCSKSSFSGLWTEFHKQPMTDPATAPKSTQLLQKLVFGAVDGIPQILPQPRKAHNCSKSSFSGLWTEFQRQPINRTCASQILPQPRKAENYSKSSFSGLWTAFHKQPMTDPTTAPKSKQLLQ